MDSETARSQLVATLAELTRLHVRLTEDARDPGVPITDIIAQVSAIERLDDRRDDLIGDLRREASQRTRAARPSTSIRETVLDAVTELGWPQNAKFLEEFLWTTRRLHFESRAFAPLRRDEQRAWARGRGVRPAYVAPALSADGIPNPRWITSSAWDLERRVVASETTERLLDLQKILALGAHAGEEGDARQRRPVDALIERYAADLLGLAPPPVTAGEEEAARWRGEVLAVARRQAEALRKKDDPRRKKAAAQLASLPEAERIWGKTLNLFHVDSTWKFHVSSPCKRCLASWHAGCRLARPQASNLPGEGDDMTKLRWASPLRSRAGRCGYWRAAGVSGAILLVALTGCAGPGGTGTTAASTASALPAAPTSTSPAAITATTQPAATPTPAATTKKPAVAKTQPPVAKTAPPASHAPVATTRAAAPPAPPKTSAPAAPALVSCHPLTNGGNCYEPGETCRATDHGASGVAGDGKAIKCEDNDGWRWEPV